MAIFRERTLSRSELFALFVACTIPIHIWSLVNTFTEVPAWVNKMSLWEVIGVVAYTQTFALLETILVALPLVLLLFLLPRFLTGDHIVPLGMIIIIPVTVWLIILQLNANWIDDRNAMALGIWGLSLIAALGVCALLVIRSEKLQKVLQQVSDRIVVLAVFLLAIDFVSVLIVVTRNAAGAFS